MLIESKDNKIIKEYLNLANNKKLRDKKSLFVVEGVRLIFDAIKQGTTFKNIFLTENCLKKIKNEKYDISKLSNFQIITEKISKLIKKTETSQGAFGIAEKFKTFDPSCLQKDDNCLALVEVSDPGNVGTLLRSAFCFGLSKIILYNCCDIYNPKTIRSSMGAVFGLKFSFSSNFEDTINILNKKSIKTFAAVVSSSSSSPESLNNKNGVLILGGEANGLSLNLVSKCVEKIKIKMFEKAESLNVAVAGSILLYEWTKNFI